MWNTDISTAPRGRTETRTRTVKDKTQEYEEFVPDVVWLATKCGKVIRTHWNPQNKFSPARWVGLGPNEQPIAWQPFIVPVHPSVEAGHLLTAIKTGELSVVAHAEGSRQ